MSSECSSGCQSGWTTYFLHSSSGERNSPCYRDGQEEEEEESLSMVSDASSGPPHFSEDDGNNGCFLYSALVPTDGGKKKRRTLVEQQQRNQHSSALDDTASSQLFFNNSQALSLSLSLSLLLLHLLLTSYISQNSFTDCNYRMNKSMEETLDFSTSISVPVNVYQEQVLQVTGKSPTRPGSRKKGRKMY